MKIAEAAARIASGSKERLLIGDPELRQDLARKSPVQAARFSWAATIDATFHPYKTAATAREFSRVRIGTKATRVAHTEPL